MFGKPNPAKISTSHVERQNLNMRMGMRRFTRLTNGFSKKVENHAAMVALYMVFYNFCRVHKSLRVTPAMEAGLADHVWDMEEVVAVMDERAPKPARPKTYRKREPKIPNWGTTAMSQTLDRGSPGSRRRGRDGTRYGICARLRGPASDGRVKCERGGSRRWTARDCGPPSGGGRPTLGRSESASPRSRLDRAPR